MLARHRRSARRLGGGKLPREVWRLRALGMRAVALDCLRPAAWGGWIGWRLDLPCAFSLHLGAEPGDGARKPHRRRHLGNPAQSRACFLDGGLAAFRVVLSLWLEDQL